MIHLSHDFSNNPVFVDVCDNQISPSIATNFPVFPPRFCFPMVLVQFESSEKKLCTSLQILDLHENSLRRMLAHPDRQTQGRNCDAQGLLWYHAVMYILQAKSIFINIQGNASGYFWTPFSYIAHIFSLKAYEAKNTGSKWVYISTWSDILWIPCILVLMYAYFLTMKTSSAGQFYKTQYLFSLMSWS